MANITRTERLLRQTTGQMTKDNNIPAGIVTGMSDSFVLPNYSGLNPAVKKGSTTSLISGSGVSGRIPLFNGTTTLTSISDITYSYLSGLSGYTHVTIGGIDFNTEYYHSWADYVNINFNGSYQNGITNMNNLVIDVASYCLYGSDGVTVVLDFNEQIPAIANASANITDVTNKLNTLLQGLRDRGLLAS